MGAQRVAQLGPHYVTKHILSTGAIGPGHALQEREHRRGIGLDAPARVGRDLHVLADARLDVERDVLPVRLPRLWNLQYHETIVEPDDRIDGPRPLETQPGLHDRAYRIAKPGNDDVLGLIHDVTARIYQGDHHESRDQKC